MNNEALLREPKGTKVAGFLSNFEVFDFFKEQKEASVRNSRQAQKLKHNTHLNTISYETLQYLQNEPCAVQTKDAISMFMNLIQPFGLTKSEKLTVLNTRPTQPVDIQAIVEESEERLSEEQINDLIDVVQKTLPPISSDRDDRAEDS